MNVKKQYIPKRYRSDKLNGRVSGASFSSSAESTTQVSGDYLPRALFDLLFEYDPVNDAIRAKKSLYSDEELSAYGLGNTAGGGTGYERLDDWLTYDETKGGWVLSALLGKDLLDRISQVETRDSDKHYRHTQSVPSTLWAVNHNLNKYPAVTVIDSANTEVVGEVEYVNENTLNIKFAYQFSGTALCN